MDPPPDFQVVHIHGERRDRPPPGAPRSRYFRDGGELRDGKHHYHGSTRDPGYLRWPWHDGQLRYPARRKYDATPRCSDGPDIGHGLFRLDRSKGHRSKRPDVDGKVEIGLGVFERVTAEVVAGTSLATICRDARE